MQLPKEECAHIAQVLKETKIALQNKNSIALKELSSKTIHSSCISQDSSSITIAVIVYSLAKIVERGDFKQIRNWDNLVKKIGNLFDLAARSIKENKIDKYQKYVGLARKTLTTHSVTLKPYISQVLKKAAINKGSKIYEHGISLEQTSRLLGISQWELSSYVGQKAPKEKRLRPSLDIKDRAKMALEFFS